VNDLAPGDRVIPTHHYTARASGDGAREGVITNQASRELQLVARGKLMRVPANMPDDVAAVFGLNAQTAYSMIRRLRLRDGARVLVTSAGASVSLAVVAALRAKSITTFAATTSPHVAQTLDALGVAGTLVVDRDGPPFRATMAVNEFAAACGGFDAVIDPFFDLHVEKAVEILAPFGQYITCGLAGQNPNSRRAAGVEAPIDGTRLLTLVGLKNISIIGNCLGLTDDLAAALDDYAAGRLRTFVDSVFTGDDVAPFLSRTFGGARIGKVAYRFAD
jgi:NADPH:quinone reductase-like Zn-dependent oxidoreductase